MKRFTWDKVENLIRCLANFKAKMEYNNSGFNADKRIVYINANRLSFDQVDKGEISDIQRRQKCDKSLVLGAILESSFAILNFVAG